MPEKFALVCEGPHDQSVAEALVERVLQEEIEWYEGNEEFLRVWCRKDDGPALRWTEDKCYPPYFAQKRVSRFTTLYRFQLEMVSSGVQKSLLLLGRRQRPPHSKSIISN
jgi:hypothetical protein